MSKKLAQVSALARRRAVIMPAAALLLAAGAPAAFAAPAAVVPNDSHIHTHDLNTPVSTNADDPDVCEFYIDGFKFDPNESLHWAVIEGTPGNPGATVFSGNTTFTTDPMDLSGPLNTGHTLNPNLNYFAQVTDNTDTGNPQIKKTAPIHPDACQGQTIPMANPAVLGGMAAVAAPAAIGIYFWRRRNSGQPA